MLNSSIVVYVADDHEIVAKGISSMLSQISFVKEVRTFNNGKELYKAVLSSRPDIVFLDIEMPEWDGIRTLEKLSVDYPEIPCLVLSMIDEKSIVEECIKKGALGYLHKDSKSNELESAILCAQKKEVYFSEETKKILTGVKKTIQSDQINLTEPLTQRELEVLELICEGLTSKEIGEKLFVSHRTVETHKNNLMQKFEAKTTGKLISLAIKNRVVK